MKLASKLGLIAPLAALSFSALAADQVKIYNWFDYTGGEFPPLSIGTRSGRVTFTAIPHGSFVLGQVTGEVFGDPQ